MTENKPFCISKWAVLEAWRKVYANKGAAGADEVSIKEFETHGYTLSLGEWERDINAVGVPLIAPDGSGVFAFNCGAPAFHYPPSASTPRIS